MTECPHRKEEFRLESCQGCRGAVELKIYKCDLHGECTLATNQKVPGIHVCDVVVPVHEEPVRVSPRKAKREKGTYENVQAGTMLANVKSDERLASVRLGDGREITALNENCITKHKLIRCVVAEADVGWILLQ